MTVRRGGESFEVRARPEELAGIDGLPWKPLPDGRFEVTFRFTPPSGIEGVSLAVAPGASRCASGLAEEMGMSAAEHAATDPTIALAQVHAALTYYYDHRDEIRAAIAEEDRFVEELKAKSGPSFLHERLGQRNASDHTIPS